MPVTGIGEIVSSSFMSSEPMVFVGEGDGWAVPVDCGLAVGEAVGEGVRAPVSVGVGDGWVGVGDGWNVIVGVGEGPACGRPSSSSTRNSAATPPARTSAMTAARARSADLRPASPYPNHMRVILQPGRVTSSVSERVTGIEPAPRAWKARALPLSYTRAPQSDLALRPGHSNGPSPPGKSVKSVGAAGFEPATSCSQSRRANQAALRPASGQHSPAAGVPGSFWQAGSASPTRGRFGR